MEQRSNLQTLKPFKKYLQIKPSLSQTNLNTGLLRNYVVSNQSAGLVFGSVNSTEWDPFLLGLNDKIKFINPGKSIWDTGAGNEKRYKIRLHSKKSGKKIDFNIDFNIDRRITDRTKKA